MTSFQLRSSLLRRAWVLLLGGCLFLTAAGRSADAPVNPPAASAAGVLAFSLPVTSSKIKLSDLRALVISASTRRGWAVAEQTEDKVVVHLAKHGYDATVTFALSATEIQTWCAAKKQPDSWLKFLKTDLTNGLNTLTI